MHTAILVVPAVNRGVTLSGGTTQRPATGHEHRRRLLQVLAGPANTPSLHRPPASRHDRSTGPAAQADHR